MERGSIEREIHIEASPEVVFEVISTPEHLRQWWPDDVDIEPVPGATGELVFGSGDDPRAHVAPMTVVEVDRPRRFSFRWVDGADQVPAPGNSLLVTFDLEPSGSGTMLRMTEVGFRERGWEAAVLEQQYGEHCQGWDHFLPRLPEYVARLVSTR